MREEIAEANSSASVHKSKEAPAWMLDKIWKPIVKKMATEKQEEL
jgi:hypothetical protein